MAKKTFGWFPDLNFTFQRIVFNPKGQEENNERSEKHKLYYQFRFHTNYYPIAVTVAIITITIIASYHCRHHYCFYPILNHKQSTAYYLC